MKRSFTSPLIILLAVCALLLPLISLSAPAVTDESEYSSSVSHEDKSNVKYKLDPGFDVELDATYGDFDTDKDGVNDFVGIAVDLKITNISEALAYGIAGIDARLCFDNTILDPLYKTSKELNGSALNPPPTVTNFPTYRVKIPAAGGLEIDVFSIDEGLCKAYAHTDGSYNNPNQSFTGPESYISCNYVINLSTHVAYKENKVGLVTADNVSFRYYFKILDESKAGGEFTFTVPDSPNAELISEAVLKAPRYTGGTPSFSNVTGRGDSVTLKLWKESLTTPDQTTEVTTPVETTPKPAETTSKPAETTSKPVETTPTPITTEKPIETTVDPIGTTEAPIYTTAAPGDTDVPTIVTTDNVTSAPTTPDNIPSQTSPPSDVIITDNTTASSPDSTAQSTSPDSEGGSCGSFTNSAVICVLVIIPLTLLMARTVKKDENKDY